MKTDKISQRSRLIEIIRERSYGTGIKITLASGRVSDFYFNMKPTMLHPEGAYLIGELVLDAIADRDVSFMGGLEVGAIPIATAVAAASYRRKCPIGAFFVRKEAKGHGTRKLVEGLPPHATLSGQRVIVVEDVASTGASSLKACEVVRAEGADLLGVVAIVDRQESAAETFAEAGIPFAWILQRADFL